MLANPFGFQDVGLGPHISDAPLWLWKWEVPEERYWVPIDDTDGAFANFTEFYAEPTTVTDGRLITVAGETGFGKTSLANRCVSWLARECLPARRTTFDIIDLHGETGGDSEERFSSIYELIVIRLEDKLNLAGHHAQLASYIQRPAVGYAQLSRLMADVGTVAVVLLPPTTVTGELPKYAKLAETRPHFIFFAESGSAEVNRECESVLAGSPAHIPLKIGKLNSHDAWNFVKNRISHLSPPGIQLSVSEKQLTAKLKELPALNSIRALQLFFFRLFEYARNNGITNITVREIQRFWNQNSNFTDLGR